MQTALCEYRRMTRREIDIEEAAEAYARSQSTPDLDHLVYLALPLATKMARQLGRRRNLPAPQFDAEQLGLDALLAALKRYKGPGRFSGLLWTIISRRCLDAYRRLVDNSRAGKPKQKRKPKPISLDALKEQYADNPHGDRTGMGFLPTASQEPRRAHHDDLDPIYALDLTHTERRVIRALLATHCNAAEAGALLGFSDFGIWYHMRAIKKKAKGAQG